MLVRFRYFSSARSLYHYKLLSLFFLVFSAVLLGRIFPSSAPGEGYTPILRTKVLGLQNSQESRISQASAFAIRQEIIAKKFVPSPTLTLVPKPEAWGKATQIGEYTWTINVGDDERAGTAEEIFQALNDYRQKKGRHTLQWSGALASYAKSRADTFAGMEKTDAHAGFKEYLENQDGFTKLGFMSIGENSSYGYKVLGVHLIEWVYAGDAPHDNNQLSNEWTHVGVGVNGVATDLIFAAKPM